MIKSKLLKVLALGLCMSALYTGAAYASQTGGGSAPAYAGGQTDPTTDPIYEKQVEIDQYLFTDHAKDVAEKGFQIVYTGVADGYVEIGITPYSDENAKYLYSLFGDDIVKIVKSDEAVTYDAAVSYANTGVASDGVAVNKTLEAPATDAAVPTKGTTAPDAAAGNTGVAGDDQLYTIQIESLEGAETPADSASQTEVAPAADATYQTVSAPVGQENADIRTVSAADESAQGNVVSTTAEKKDSVSAPMIILAIAGGAVLIGGAVLVTLKKRV